MRIKDSMVDVFALDYGCTILVNKSELFELPEELQLSLCPQNASLCTVAGKNIGVTYTVTPVLSGHSKIDKTKI